MLEIKSRIAAIIIAFILLLCLPVNADEPGRWEIGAEISLDGTDVFPIDLFKSRLYIRTDFVFDNGEYIEHYGYTEGIDTVIFDNNPYYLKSDSMQIGEDWFGWEGEFVEYRVNSTAGLNLATGFYPRAYACGIYGISNGDLIDYRYFVSGHGPVRSSYYGWLTGENIVGGDGFLPLHEGNSWDFIDLPPFEGTNYLVEVRSDPPGMMDFIGHVRSGDIYPELYDQWADTINIAGSDVYLDFRVESVEETVETPAGIFENCVYTKVDILVPPFLYDSLKFYNAEGVGQVKAYALGMEARLEDFEIVGGFGYDPYEIGNWWRYDDGSTLTVVAFEDHLGYDCYRMEDESQSVTTWINVVGPSTSVNDDTEELPINIRLSRNYPNPFNTSTTIQYNTGNIPGEITVYNIRGRLVATTKVYGGGSFIWDGFDSSSNPVSSGVYLYSLKGGEERITKRMVLLK